MQINTTRFGSIDIVEEEIISFPEGIPGFEELKRFTLIAEEAMEYFHWLQSVDDPAVAFLVVNTFTFFPDYDFNLPADDIEILQLQSPGEVAVLTTLTVTGDNIAEITANKVGPMVVNTRLNLAKQVILMDPSFSVKHPLFAGREAAPGSVDGGKV